MLEEVKEIINRGVKLSDQEAFISSVNSEIRQLIINLNTEVQLGDFGIDADDKDLGDYADYTINERLRKGLQVAHIDFKVTGDYWRSWKVKVVGDEIQISVNQSRYDELVDELRFSKTHVGLTVDNLGVLAQEMLFGYRDYVIKKLFRNG